MWNHRGLVKKQFEEGESEKGLANTCEEQINSEGWELRIGLDNLKVTSTLVKNSTLEYLDQNIICWVDSGENGKLQRCNNSFEEFWYKIGREMGYYVERMQG